MYLRKNYTYNKYISWIFIQHSLGGSLTSAKNNTNNTNNNNTSNNSNDNNNNNIIIVSNIITNYQVLVGKNLVKLFSWIHIG